MTALRLAPLHFQQLLVAQGDVLGAQAGVGGAQEVLAVEVLLRLDLRLVDAEEAGRGDAQEPLQAGLPGQGALKLRPLGGRELVGAGDELPELGGEAGADRGVAFCLVRVVADDEPVAVVAEADLLDLEVVPHGLVAARPWSRCRAGPVPRARRAGRPHPPAPSRNRWMWCRRKAGLLRG